MPNHPTYLHDKWVFTQTFGDSSSGERFSLLPAHQERSIKIAQIELWCGDSYGGWPNGVYTVEGIRITWKDDSFHEAGRCSATPTKTFGFEDDELITGMSIRSNWRVDKIHFETNRSNTLDCGGSGGSKTQLSDIGNGQLVGVQGTANSHLLSLSFVFWKKESA
ncbi:hypothetical protein BDV30DRAFT_221719 [Aspergillus minisclerotigenes]|uniref:Jacalin-type lectin domain-containing protein n=1 Tax=Aspergillus minisclerotigenes TaxID=656917 RepID=A0A5N6IIG6_9EURO|nr:hypothetical protein BDV30DRAFT_221719 [Aspergillus minisclerotigenes]